MNAQTNITINTAASTAIPVLQARGLMKYYAQRCILNNINLVIEPGTVVGLIGRNGAGKSTLLRSLLGLQKIEGGDCLVYGEPAFAISDSNKARIGYVPQQPEALGWLTVKQMLDFVSGFYPNWDHNFVAVTLERWGIEPRGLLSKLSPGERQRIAILRALAYHPELLVLDEPAAALDPVARRELLRDIVTRAADSGTTVIFSTHIVSDLERVASEIVFVHEKSILLQMPMDDIKERTTCLRLPAEVLARSGSSQQGKLPGEISRRLQPDGNLSIVLQRDGNRDWPALCTAPGARMEALNLEDLFIEVAQ
jgi:ABC-2 type transport system ATP-binding protein